MFFKVQKYKFLNYLNEFSHLIIYLTLLPSQKVTGAPCFTSYNLFLRDFQQTRSLNPSTDGIWPSTFVSNTNTLTTVL